MKHKYYVGVDISKATLDFCIVCEGVFLHHEKVNNAAKDIKSWISKIRSEYKVGGKNTVYCMEHSGAYQEVLLQVLQTKNANVWLESPLRIKRSEGIQRAKNDKVDSQKIALYAYNNKNGLRLWKGTREVILKLRHLSSLRVRLLNVLFALRNVTEEGFTSVSKEYKQLVLQHCDNSIQQVKSDLQRTESSIHQLIQEDDFLSRLFTIVTSVEGIGPIVAIELIIVSNEFKNFASAKKFACYCGVAPFEHTSGTSVRGKTKVSHLANKKIKSLLHLPVLCLIRRNAKGEIKDYYERKVKEGKPKMSVINALKNKLIQRVFTCVKEQRVYQKVRVL